MTVTGTDEEARVVEQAEQQQPAPALRPTPQRRAVEAALDASDDFRTAQEIHERLRREGEKVGLATVYRTLQSLVDAAAADTVRTDGGEVAYRRCSRTHHHHLVCRVCGSTVEVTGPAVESWADSVAAEFDYTDVDHTLELVGTCAACRRGGGA